MCYHFSLKKKQKDIEKRFDAKFADEVPNSQLSMNEFNGFGFPFTPVITNSNRNYISIFQWGLIPQWAKDESIQKNTLNARVETIHEKPSFKDVVHNRCLVIADGFFEWKWLDTSGKKKEKYHIKHQQNSLFTFAGLYSEWNNPTNGEKVKTYSILTTEANDLMSSIHIKKRMPIILDQKDEQLWIEGTEITHFKFPYEQPLEAINLSQQLKLF